MSLPEYFNDTDFMLLHFSGHPSGSSNNALDVDLKLWIRLSPRHNEGASDIATS
ncbi:unnamed protein product [Larinioides sclopetarius]|uniref:Uncharacterized protein n=1 Tax=Larinioides sclopetarius TaxID=280406 RepID=A0AAV1ZV22_9ARAC